MKILLKSGPQYFFFSISVFSQELIIILGNFIMFANQFRYDKTTQSRCCYVGTNTHVGVNQPNVRPDQFHRWPSNVITGLTSLVKRKTRLTCRNIARLWSYKSSVQKIRIFKANFVRQCFYHYLTRQKATKTNPDQD